MNEFLYSSVAGLRVILSVPLFLYPWNACVRDLLTDAIQVQTHTRFWKLKSTLVDLLSLNEACNIWNLTLNFIQLSDPIISFQ
ncbi:hypothetical protein FGO68_gene4451 [Halteria grandinella]|uniref:Uncharacterized protein n=1 Tax=Halteria grandinella TaxID=5974 RepID=A0A8J8T0D9_HALGN|nr:hypothetical protein FGO68_gene4451 [Halteria grandinella]